MQLIRKTLAFGQFPSSKGDLYVPASGRKGFAHNVLIHNTNTTAESVVLNFHDGTSEHQVLSQDVAAGDTLFLEFPGEGEVVDEGAKFTGNTTTASKVTFKFSGTEELVASVDDRFAQGAVSNLWLPPATPNALDMEFNTGIVDAGWSVRELDTPAAGTISSGTVDAYDTTFSSGTAVRINQNPIDRPSWMLIQAPSRSPFRRFSVYRSITLPTNLLILARMKFQIIRSGALAEDAYVGLSLHLANAGNPEFPNSLHLYLNETEAGETLAEYRYYNAGGTGLGLYETTTTSSEGQALEYVAIHKIGTDYYGWAGTASGNWIFMEKFTSAEVPYTPDILSIMVSNVGGITDIGPRIVGVDFIRFYETDNFLF